MNLRQFLNFIFQIFRLCPGRSSFGMKGMKIVAESAARDGCEG
jgi:hypothetical protein